MRGHPARRSAPATDEAFLRQCLALASRAEGRTSPNPLVGSIVARGRRILAEAWHRRAGGVHAERGALRRAGRAARGSTLYTNLEPCCHWGRTPPCVDAIIAAGVRRVVVSHKDPDQRVNGKGIAALRRAGIEVTVGGIRREAMQMNERHVLYHTRHRPFVLVKAAMTLDGRIAARDGSSHWISSRASRAQAHRMRAAHDAVLVGAGTVRADDPRLTVRRGSRSLSSTRRPLRVVIDGTLSIPYKARLLRQRSGGPVIFYATGGAPRARLRRLEKLGALVVIVPSEKGDSRRVRMDACLEDLARRGVTSVLVEGGGEVIASMLKDNLVDRMVLFVAPLIVGGRTAVPVAGGAGASSIGAAVRLASLEVSRCGTDLLIDARVRRRSR